MPEFLGMDKKKWMWVGIAVAGVAGLYLLTRQGGGSGAGAPEAGLPETGPPHLGNMTPPAGVGGFFNQEEQIAAFQSSRDRFIQNRHEQAAYDIAPTGIVSKAWRQLNTGGWEDLHLPGHVISEDEARQIGPSNHGPYAQGGGGFIKKYVLPLISQIVLPNVIGAYRNNQPITAGSAFLGPKTAQPTPYSGRTPPIAPTPRYGNSPAMIRTAEIREVT